ncbi:hypothetical protein ACFXPR_21715 [Nocardia tengchongensis]|uniref:hypothetical protein n=1 Tax=Nocardia tengchongensis TaxID=2055889 RepID=UPI0036BA5813
MSLKAFAASATAVLAALTLIGCSSSSAPDQPSTTIAAATTRPVSATPGSSPATASARRSACVGMVAVLGLAARSHVGDPQWSLQNAADELMTEWLSSPDAATATPDENAGFTAGARDAVALVARGLGDDQCP